MERRSKGEGGKRDGREGKGGGVGSYAGFLGKGTTAALPPPCFSSSLIFFRHRHIFHSLQNLMPPDRSLANYFCPLPQLPDYSPADSVSSFPHISRGPLSAVTFGAASIDIPMKNNLTTEQLLHFLCCFACRFL